jgi:hypothetical protein
VAAPAAIATFAAVTSAAGIVLADGAGAPRASSTETTSGAATPAIAPAAMAELRGHQLGRCVEKKGSERAPAGLAGLAGTSGASPGAAPAAPATPAIYAG